MVNTELANCLALHVVTLRDDPLVEQCEPKHISGKMLNLPLYHVANTHYPYRTPTVA